MLSDKHNILCKSMQLLQQRSRLETVLVYPPANCLHTDNQGLLFTLLVLTANYQYKVCIYSYKNMQDIIVHL